MKEANSSLHPAPMEGHGAYNRSSRVQAAGSLPAVPLLEQAARAVDLDTNAIVIADYGSSQGHNSFGPMTAAIRCLRERIGPERAVSVVHTDLPDNDFSALFRALGTDEQSYLRGDPAVFAFAAGRSFYEQVLPDETVTLGWSAWAVQWLSGIPCPIPDQVQVAYSRDEAARAAYARQAEADWRTFLTHRGRELRPGGRLVVLTMALAADGAFGYRPILEALYDSLLQLAGEGFLSPAELHRMAIPTAARSHEDFVGPFCDGGRFAGLAVENIEIFQGDDLIWNRFERDRDARGFGAQWAAFSRASVSPTLALALDGGRDDPRTAEFLDRVEAGMTARLSASPEKMIIPLGSLTLVKSPHPKDERRRN